MSSIQVVNSRRKPQIFQWAKFGEDTRTVVKQQANWLLV